MCTWCIVAKFNVVASSCSLTIEEQGTGAKRTKGIFNFEGVNADSETIQVTEGYFYLGYQQAIPLPGITEKDDRAH
jgi:hypothetical protein